MANFKPFAEAVWNRFNEFQSSNDVLFIKGSDNRALEQVYLESFPEGTNKVFKTNLEYDCNCCKNFIRNIGSVIQVSNGKIKTIWDIEGLEYPFNIVAEKMNEYVLSQPIHSIFLTEEKQYGAERTHDHTNGIMWNHFYANINAKFYKPKTTAELKGKYKTNVDVLSRSLTSITNDAIKTVIELIESNSIYRGQEFLSSVKSFKKLKDQLKNTRGITIDEFSWENANKPGSLIKNTVIGTLLVDLSEGVDESTAVRSYESKIAPMNYKRPTALVTKTMLDNAAKKIQELGVESALYRRHATLADVSINDVIWADHSAKQKMKSDSKLSALIDTHGNKQKSAVMSKDTGIEIAIEDFIASVVPKTKSMQLLFVSKSNLMSVTAPIDASAKSILKWNNNFAWTYNGNVTDSVKDRVKAAGGNVNAPFRISLSWFNTDDLDIHVHAPHYGNISYYEKKGCLDVDMNVSGPLRRDAVENVSFINVYDGVYQVSVNNFRKRETVDVGCSIQVEFDGKIFNYSKSTAIGSHEKFLTINVKNSVLQSIFVNQKSITETTDSISTDIWGIKTNTFIPVETLMYSPNHWSGNSVGNKHYLFILEGCKVDEELNGFFNEYLSADFSEHRKAFELFSNKLKVEVANEQLSGVGYSSTKKDSVKILTNDGKSSTLYTVKF